ncbi:hypothetical protein FRB97_004000 [Tulasnella sp. 331]|nr:hypothetical protein FRB97_004000 [Tulasnella sp. 331]
MIEETSTTRRFGVGGAALPPPYRLHLSGVRCAAQSPRLSLQGAESTTPAYHQHAIWKDAGAYGNIQRTGEAKDHPPQRPRSSLNEGDERPHGLGPRNLVELNISQSGEEATDLDVLIAALPETEAELEVPGLTLNNRVTIPYEHIRPLTRLPKLKVIALTIRTLLAALSTSDGISGTFDDDASMDHEAAAANEPMLPEIGLCFFGRDCLKLKLLKIRLLPPFYAGGFKPYRRPSFQDDAVVASEDDFDMDPSAPSKRVLDVVTFLADICRREMELRVSESKRWTDDVAWTHVRGAYPVWRDLGRERMWIKASLTIYFICRRGELSVHSETELEEGLLGRGGYGTVRRGDLSDNLSTYTVAVKQLHLNESTDVLRLAYRLLLEIKVWRQLNHPNVLPFIGFDLSPQLDRFIIVSELMPLGDINGYIKRAKPDVHTRLRLAGQDNILVRTATGAPLLLSPDIPTPLSDGSLVVAVLCDFGLARALEPTGLTSSSTKQRGSFYWFSPEVLKGGEKTKESDMWAWGCLIREILLEKKPYDLSSNFFGLLNDAVLKERLPGTPNMILGNSDLSKMVQQCWSYEPQIRADVDHCCLLLLRARIMEWAANAHDTQTRRYGAADRRDGLVIVPWQPNILAWVQSSNRSHDDLRAVLSSFVYHLKGRETEPWSLVQEAQRFIAEIDRDIIEKTEVIEPDGMSTTASALGAGVFGKLKRFVVMSRTIWGSHIDRWTRFMG